MMNKKGYMRTLEAFTAIIMTFVFVIFVIPQFEGNEVRREAIDIMTTAIKDDAFRNCVLTSDITTAENCTSEVIADFMPETYEFKIEISNTREFQATGLPDKRVFAESAMISGNMTTYSPRFVRLYYWFP